MANLGPHELSYLLRIPPILTPETAAPITLQHTARSQTSTVLESRGSLQQQALQLHDSQGLQQSNKHALPS